MAGNGKGNKRLYKLVRLGPSTMLVRGAEGFSGGWTERCVQRMNAWVEGGKAD